MKSIYILLTRSTTIMSRLVSLMTSERYTHSAIALEKDLKHLYSFGRRCSWMPFPAGFVSENLYDGYFSSHRDIPCALYEIKVSEEVYESICCHIEMIRKSPKKYKYNLIGVALCMLDIEFNRRYHYFCSQFVAELLSKSGALELPKPAALMHPNDYTCMQQLDMLYMGSVEGLDCIF